MAIRSQTPTIKPPRASDLLEDDDPLDPNKRQGGASGIPASGGNPTTVTPGAAGGGEGDVVQAGAPPAAGDVSPPIDPNDLLGGGGSGGGDGGGGGSGGSGGGASAGGGLPGVGGLGGFVQNSLSNPSRYDIEAVQNATELINQQLQQGWQNARNRLDETMASRGLVGSSIEMDQRRELAGQVERQRLQRMSDLEREMARTWAQDRSTAGQMGLQLNRQQIDAAIRQRALDLQEQGMSLDEAFRRAELEVREQLGREEISMRREELAAGRQQDLMRTIMQVLSGIGLGPLSEFFGEDETGDPGDDPTPDDDDDWERTPVNPPDDDQRGGGSGGGGGGDPNRVAYSGGSTTGGIPSDLLDRMRRQRQLLGPGL